MVAFAQTKPEEKRVRLTRKEATALIAAVIIGATNNPPPGPVGMVLEAIVNRIIRAFDMDFESCDECGITIDGITVLLPGDEEDE